MTLDLATTTTPATTATLDGSNDDDASNHDGDTPEKLNATSVLFSTTVPCCNHSPSTMMLAVSLWSPAMTACSGIASNNSTGVRSME